MSFQLDALEQDALETHSNLRPLRNTLAPINRIPPEVLSLIPDYSDEDDPDQVSIALHMYAIAGEKYSSPVLRCGLIWT